VTKRGF